MTTTKQEALLINAFRALSGPEQEAVLELTCQMAGQDPSESRNTRQVSDDTHFAITLPVNW